MSLTHPQTMSDENKEAPQRNARLSHGPATPGRVGSAVANLHRQSLEELEPLAEPPQQTHAQVSRQFAQIDSPEGMAALMAPRGKEERARLLQRMEDSSLQRLTRLVAMLKQVRQGDLDSREKENADRSGYVYENT